MRSAPNPGAPSVSVVIPAYRASRDIGEALASVFRQTFADFEAIVVNDGSPDTVELERALAPYSSRVRYISQPNRGAAAARNCGVRASRGDLIAFLDADDLWMPAFLERQVEWLQRHPSCALVYCDALITGSTPLARRRFSDTAPSSGPVTLLGLLQQRCNIMLSTVVVRRSTLVAAAMFDESIARGHDADLWFRLALAGARMHYQPLVLAERRVRTDGLSGDRSAELTRAIGVFDRFGRNHDLPLAERIAVRVRIGQLRTELDIEEAKRRLVEGDFSAARARLSPHRPSSMKVRAAVVALRVAPRLLRRCYLALRHGSWAAARRPATMSGETAT
jgi:glycosyltransferase involved in cell wall biosynthesis